MGGSTGNTSNNGQSGRPAHNANHDITARHGDDLAHGVRDSDDTGASTSARASQNGNPDRSRHDPDRPAPQGEETSKA